MTNFGLTEKQSLEVLIAGNIRTVMVCFMVRLKSTPSSFLSFLWLVVNLHKYVAVNYWKQR